MLDDFRRFSTGAFPEELRPAAWNEVLTKVLLRSDAGAKAHKPLDGYVSSRTSTLDSVFITLASSCQSLSPHPSNAHRYGSAVLLLALLEGSGLVTESGETVALSAGDMIVLDPSQSWHIDLNTSFRAVAVKLESASFILRLLRTRGQDLNKISSANGVGAVCMNVVRSISDELDGLARHELLPVEATLTELLVTSLSHTDEDLVEDATSVQLGHLRRVCRTIEARLSDPDLSIEDIGRIEALSTSYVQKLFKVGSTTFGEYVRGRRLERCRLDLVNVGLAHFTISELCFRWGFGDVANFSRAFTARFGISPKAYRAEPPKESDHPTQRGRPTWDRGSGRREKAEMLVPAGPDRDEESNPLNPFHEVLNDHARIAVALAYERKRVSDEEAATQRAQDDQPPNHFYVPVSDRTVHWGYFSHLIKPAISVRSGDIVTIETLTQHASDDAERMISGDPGAESVFHWTAQSKGVERRGAGPMDASVFGRGAGEGFGVHICTGPVFIHDAQPGDVLEIRILDIRPRPSCHPSHHGRFFGSNAAAWWGFQYQDLLTEPKKREVVTVYELHTASASPHARAVYNFRWTPQTDPFGVVHETIDYPGVPVDASSVSRKFGVLAEARVPIRPHFGVLAVAPREGDLVDSVPPGYFGGNLDNWRAGKGAKLFLPVSVDGALFSVGDPHAAQGDSELCGTAIECSLTGTFQFVLHKRHVLGDSFLGGLSHPFLETSDEWVIQGFSFPNHLVELGAQAQTQVYKKSSLEGAMRDAFRKTRRFLMKAHALSEDEAISLLSVAVDFGITQVVNGNWGVHAIVKKKIFPDFAGLLP